MTLKAKEACIQETHKTITKEQLLMGIQALSRISTEGAEKTAHAPVSPWKRFIWKLSKLLPEGQVSNLEHIRGCYDLPQGLDSWQTPPPLSLYNLLQVTCFSQKEVRAHICTKAFVAVAQGTCPPIAWVSLPMGLPFMNSTGLYKSKKEFLTDSTQRGQTKCSSPSLLLKRLHLILYELLPKCQPSNLSYI